MMMNQIIRAVLLFSLFMMLMPIGVDAAKDKKCKCIECDKIVGRQHMKEHIKAMHTWEPSRICDRCGLCFSAKWRYSDHRNICSGKSMCCKRYSQSEYSNAWDDAYECSVCSRKFRCEEYRNRHEEIHQQFHECVDCGMYFSTKIFLDQHQMPNQDEASVHRQDIAAAVQQDSLLLMEDEDRTGLSPIEDEDQTSPFGSDRNNYEYRRLEAYIDHCCMRGYSDFGTEEFIPWIPQEPMNDL